MGLLGGIVDDRGAFGLDGGQHDVHRRADGDNIKENIAAGQLIAFGGDETADFLGVGTQGLEAFEMLIHGTGADVAAAGRGNLRLTAAAEQGTQQIIAGAETLGVAVGNGSALRGAGIDRHHVPRFIIHLCPKLPQDIRQGVDILNVREILNGAGFIAQQSGRNDSHGCILSAADMNLPFERLTAGDQHPIR